jgi:hypothetical protein
VIAARIISAAALLALAPPAAAEPLTADLLPPALLADCEAKADAFGRYAPAIAGSVRALGDLGVFAAKEFEDVRIGYCPLQAAGGPVATASCADGVILLDEKYARADQALVLHSTLAHEMKHHFQHRAKKAQFGAVYCESARYAADKPALEAAADAFGEAVSELFTLGRVVEIVNACDAPVMIYLEPDDSVAIRGAAPAFQRIAPKSSAIAPERALSGIVRFHARTTAEAVPAYVWQDPTGAQARFVEGRHIRLKEMRLFAANRENGPFRLRLTCAPS